MRFITSGVLLPLLAMLCLALWPARADARSDVPDARKLAAVGFKQVSLSAGGLERLFLVLEPSGSAPPSSTVVLLHGGTQSMRKLFGPNAGGTREWLALARRHNILLLVPNGTSLKTGDADGDNQVWNDLRSGDDMRASTADDVGFILKMLDWAEARYPGSGARVYATGASNGGMMTFRLLVEASERFAGGAAFIASLPDPLAGLARPAKPVPLLIANGTEDRLVQWAGGEIMGRRGTVAPVAETRAWWIEANGASPAASEKAMLPDRDPDDGCRIGRELHPAQAGGAPVLLYTMQGGGHAMPSIRHPVKGGLLLRRLVGTVCADAEGADLAWRFFEAYGQN